ncbi:hypothetical protein F5Y02DRAFT_431307 [Annulohypoxylon stygium]|nr:hypothetical protein F5Y02DRAFT_431307 [Annulohypoxylon stygium]
MESFNSESLDYPTFPRFRNLPVELRYRIYELAFPRRILTFHELLMVDHMGLAIYPLGPPAIAQECHEAWEFAKLKYRKIPYYAAKIRPLPQGPLAIISPPPTSTWFNPALDAMYVAFRRYFTLRDGNAVYNPQRIMYPDGDGEAFKGQDATYSEIVRSLLPFAKLVETAIVDPVDEERMEAHEFFPFADNEVFPRIKTVLTRVMRYRWEINWPPRPPRPKETLFDRSIDWSPHFVDLPPEWSAREYFSEDFESNEKIKAELGDLDLISSMVLISEKEWLLQRQFQVCGGDDNSPVECRFANLLHEGYHHLPSTWMTAAYYLRKCFTVSVTGDRVYSRYDFRKSVPDFDYERARVEVPRLKNGVPVPEFRTIAIIVD